MIWKRVLISFVFVAMSCGEVSSLVSDASLEDSGARLEDSGGQRVDGGVLRCGDSENGFFDLFDDQMTDELLWRRFDNSLEVNNDSLVEENGQLVIRLRVANQMNRTNIGYFSKNPWRAPGSTITLDLGEIPDQSETRVQVQFQLSTPNPRHLMRFLIHNNRLQFVTTTPSLSDPAQSEDVRVGIDFLPLEHRFLRFIFSRDKVDAEFSANRIAWNNLTTFNLSSEQMIEYQNTTIQMQGIVFPAAVNIADPVQHVLRFDAFEFCQ